VERGHSRAGARSRRTRARRRRKRGPPCACTGNLAHRSREVVAWIHLLEGVAFLGLAPRSEYSRWDRPPAGAVLSTRCAAEVGCRPGAGATCANKRTRTEGWKSPPGKRSPACNQTQLHRREGMWRAAGGEDWPEGQRTRFGRDHRRACVERGEVQTCVSGKVRRAEG